LVPILAGGGTRLPAHVGILKALKSMDIQIEHIVGVSGGSIVAALWAAGWDIEAMKKLSLEVNFTMFREFNLLQLLLHGGLSSGDIFESWMNEQLQDACFADLDKHLHVVATDITNGSPVIFNRETTPEFNVATAVRYSMGIPLLFAFKEYEHHIMTDGSILSEDSLRRDWAGNGSPSCIFRLRAGMNNKNHRRIRRWFPLPDYMQMLIRSFMTTISREFINDAFWNSTIVVETDEISPVEFDLSIDKKMLLLERGYQTTMEVFPLKFSSFAPLQNASEQERPLRR
jgi:NTE family protein